MRRLLLSAALFSLAACGGGAPDAASGDEAAEAAAAADAAADVPSVRITSPLDGDTLDAGAVTVMLEAAGVEIAPVAEGRMDTGHHHIYLDEDLRPADEPVPAIPGAIVHLGDGSSSYTFENVAPGEHRLITVMANLVHVPLAPQVTDTVVFYVR